MPQPIKILYFAWLREKTGTAEEEFLLPQGVDTLAALISSLRRRSPGFDSAFCTPKLVRAAVNQVFAAPDTLLSPGDEVAFFPPITGG